MLRLVSIFFILQLSESFASAIHNSCLTQVKITKIDEKFIHFKNLTPNKCEELKKLKKIEKKLTTNKVRINNTYSLHSEEFSFNGPKGPGHVRKYHFK